MNTRRGVMYYLESIVGSAVLVLAVACMPGLRHPMTAAAGESGGPVQACSSPLRRAPLLCNRVLRDSSAECAICGTDQRGCLSSTHIYCATSCDDPACVPRAR